MPNIPRQDSTARLKLYVSDVGAQNTKCWSTTGAECGSKLGETQKPGFTLAEILITLSIIGVVASLTIPSLIVKNQEKELIVLLKKAYNTLSTAYSLAKTEYGNIEGWSDVNLDRDIGAEMFFKHLSPYMNVDKICRTTSGCWAKDKVYKSFNGTNNADFDNYNWYFKWRNSDSMSFAGWNWNSTRGYIVVDVNGSKKPNTVGLDTFYFLVDSRGITPYGNGDDPFGANCNGGTGYNCTAWALLKENFDYPATD